MATEFVSAIMQVVHAVVGRNYYSQNRREIYKGVHMNHNIGASVIANEGRSPYTGGLRGAQIQALKAIWYVRSFSKVALP